ncbi:MAG TPA: NADH-quinone oxidoreductase subunit A [Egibacteraceae bacterium]|nr:NADH-quinone oxidoreductase subunit A [Egibacteraceae bacterium]
MFAALGTVLAVVLAAVAALLALRWLGSVTDPQQVPPPEAVPVLGGHPPPTHAWSRFHLRYYPMTLVFIAFEMEMMFMYPWAVVYVQEGMKALVEMGMFLGILSLGVLYAWREGALRWQ